jgi:hypothetical protein
MAYKCRLAGVLIPASTNTLIAMVCVKLAKWSSVVAIGSYLVATGKDLLQLVLLSCN